MEPAKSIIESSKMQEGSKSADTEQVIHTLLSEGISAEDNAGILSSWSMSFMNQILRTGDKQTLLHADLGPINYDDKCSNIQVHFDNFWAIESSKPLKDQSLWLVLWRTVGWWKVLSAMLYYLIYAGITFGPVLILNALVQHVQKTNELTTGVLWFLVAMIFALPMTGQNVPPRLFPLIRRS